MPCLPDVTLLNNVSGLQTVNVEGNPSSKCVLKASLMTRHVMLPAPAKIATREVVNAPVSHPVGLPHVSLNVLHYSPGSSESLKLLHIRHLSEIYFALCWEAVLQHQSFPCLAGKGHAPTPRLQDPRLLHPQAQLPASSH